MKLLEKALTVNIEIQDIDETLKKARKEKSEANEMIKRLSQEKGVKQKELTMLLNDLNKEVRKKR